jgi:hypothetical protein
MLSRPEIQELCARVNLRELAQGLGAVFRGRARYGSCPLCGGGKATARFEIKRGAEGEVWVCAACCQGGDAIKLVMLVKHLGFAEAVAELGGAPSLSPSEIARREAERTRQQEKREAEASRYRERMRRELYGLWKSAAPFLGTPVEAYLRGRGLQWRLEDLALRCVADLPYLDGAVLDETGRKIPRVVYRGPAMLAAFVGADGRFLGLHRTWVNPSRPGEKAEIFDPETGEKLPAKKMRGTKQGGYLRLLRAWDAGLGLVYAGEGVETTLSVRDAQRDDALYIAAGDWGNLAGPSIESIAHPTKKHGNGRALRIPGPEPDLSEPAMPVPGNCRELVLLKDGDSDAFTTGIVMARATARHACKGRKVCVAEPRPGADFNDMLRDA